MASDCTAYFNRVISQLAANGITNPADTFWAGVFAGICEQVLMKVKPAGMVGSEMPRAEEITSIVTGIYRLHRERLDKPTGGFEVWVCRSDDEATLNDLKRLSAADLDWDEYHALRGRLCGYSDAVIRKYTEGVWP